MVHKQIHVFSKYILLTKYLKTHNMFDCGIYNWNNFLLQYFFNTIDSGHSGDNGGISSEAIVGIAVGGSAAIIIVIIIAISCFAYKKKGNI